MKTETETVYISECDDTRWNSESKARGHDLWFKEQMSSSFNEGRQSEKSEPWWQSSLCITLLIVVSGAIAGPMGYGEGVRSTENKFRKLGYELEEIETQKLRIKINQESDSQQEG